MTSSKENLPEKEGFVVLKNILTSEIKEEYLELFKSGWCQVSKGFSGKINLHGLLRIYL